MQNYFGTIIKESLSDDVALTFFTVKKIEETDDETVEDRWHLYYIEAERENIEKLSPYIKEGPWYAHFCNDEELVVVFRNKVFSFLHEDKDTLFAVKEYGQSIGIKEEQLDFVIKNF